MFKKEVIYATAEKLTKFIMKFVAFEKGDYFYAEKKFQSDSMFEIVEYAASAIMASYCLYGISFYDEATESINTMQKNILQTKMIYAHYLIAF